LFVDDDSPDGTAQIIKRLQAKNQQLHLLTDRKEGLGKAYIRGLTYGLQLKSYFAIVTMDADLSHDPADIPRLLAGIEEGADYVIGSRYVAGGRSVVGYSWYRRCLSTGANLLARGFLDVKLPIKDLTGGFKAIRADCLRQIPLQQINAS